MKKSFAIFLILVMAFAFAGCGSSNNSNESASNQKVERDLPEGNYSDMGSGTMFISTDGGTSEGGNVPVIYADEDSSTTIMQIGLETEGFDGSILSYIYVDGVEVSKEQLAETMTTIELKEAQLTKGKHIVEVVQYADDDTSSDMVTYKSAQYEIKIK